MLHAASPHHSALTMSLCRMDLPMKMPPQRHLQQQQQQQHQHQQQHPQHPQHHLQQQQQLHHHPHPGLSSQVYTPVNTFEGILELRKEKSRDAARSRRGKENYEFYELAKLLPLPSAITSQLDKASIIRLSISFLKLRDFSSHGDPPWQRDGPASNKSAKGAQPRRRNITNVAMDLYEAHQGTHILQSLDGFAFNLSNDGRFLYISETVSIYLGLSQVEMTGSSIFDYVHVQDHQELAEQLGLSSTHGSYSTPLSPPAQSNHSNDDDDDDDDDSASRGDSGTPRAATPSIPERASVMNPNPSKGLDRCFCVRMKSTLTKRGVHIKSSGYRVVQILAHMRPQFSFSLTRKHPPPLLGLVGVAIALPPPTLTELVIDSDMFVTRLSPEFKITYCEPRICDMMDVSADDLTNKNLYDFCHAEDLQKLRKAHIDLLGKGQVLTDYYRLMNKHGGYIWVQTCATIICNIKNAEDQNIIAINYVLSGIEYHGCVMDTKQLKVMSKMEPDQSDQSENEQGDGKDDIMKDRDHRSPSMKDRHGGPESRRGRKRKSSTGPDDTGSVPDLADVEPQSPVDAFNLLYQKDSNGNHTAVLNGGVYDLNDQDSGYKTSDKNKVDNKNSRRKMDKPRRRKRDLMDTDAADGQLELPLSPGDNPVSGPGCADLLNGGRKSCDAACTSHMQENNSVLVAPQPSSTHSVVMPTSPPHEASSSSSSSSSTSCNKIISPVPQDLSLRSAANHSPVDASDQSNQGSSLAPAGTLLANPVTSVEVLRDGWEPTSTSADTSLSLVASSAEAGSSVRDLEEAMNKHLPSLPSETDHIRATLAAADYNQSMLGLHQKHKSTIQWIGSQPTHTPDGLPATNLLRSLYANRESVIRTNVYNPRPTYYHGENMQSTLLTPPGSTTDPYKESLSGSQLAPSKTPPSTYNGGLVTGYSTSPISVSMATGMSDTYAMTPPSSVSPQDKYSAFSDQLHPDLSASQLRSYENSLTMPIKPQAYPLPAHANSHLSAYDRSAAAAAAAAAAQYSAAGGYYGGGFPTYNSAPAPAHYRDTSRAGNAW